MTAHLILTLEAPAMSFGGEAIDNLGVVRDFPARSMITGLVANALGWDRTESDQLDALQARLDIATLRLREGQRCREYQTARLFEGDSGWTTHGVPEGRAKSPSFAWDRDWETARGTRAKSLTHQRFRDFDADALVLVALAIAGDGAPALGDIVRAFRQPERPLFLGRKPFLPSGPICAAAPVHAASPIEALFHHLVAAGWQGAARASWVPANEDVHGASPRPLEQTDTRSCDNDSTTKFRGALATERRERVTDERRHRTGVHGGSREVAKGVLTITAAA